MPDELFGTIVDAEEFVVDEDEVLEVIDPVEASKALDPVLGEPNPALKPPDSVFEAPEDDVCTAVTKVVDVDVGWWLADDIARVEVISEDCVVVAGVEVKPTLVVLSSTSCLDHHNRK